MPRAEGSLRLFFVEVFDLMKKFMCFLSALLLLAGALTGCGAHDDADGSLSVVATIFPAYDWVNQLIGDANGQVDVTLLLDNGADLHSYQPSVEDIVTIAACDMFIYVGGPSDRWVDDVLAQAGNDDMIVVNLFDILGDAVKEDELAEGEHTHTHAEDEHVWLSLRHAERICRVIGEQLCALDQGNAQTYAANTERYCEALLDLDAEYRAVIDEAPKKALLFGDRFPFRYLVDDYGIEYYAAFSGCSAESEASLETIAFLAGKLDALEIGAVLTLKGSDAGIAKTVIRASEAKNAEILTLDSMQTTTAKDAERGTTYLAVMESNLDVLRAALK